MRFIGNKKDGYSVSEPGAACNVRKTEGGWVAVIVGKPNKRNPSINGVRVCTCPDVQVGVFKTRDAAGIAGLKAYLEEYAR